MSLAEKFRGCLLGGLVGDCLGEPFELNRVVSTTVLADFLKKRLLGDGGTLLLYTDDTEMARSISESLLVNNGFDGEDLAKRFTEEYFIHGHKRNYGLFVTRVFQVLREQNYKDVFEPAKAQFDGAGSFGNGAPMRTQPVALFCYNKSQETMFDICRKISQLTHTHMDGYNGAILQTFAVRWALDADPKAAFDPNAFLDMLHNTMKTLEQGRKHSKTYPSYCSQIDKIRELLKNRALSPKMAGRELGNDETAAKSLPVAIYAFLRGMEPLQDFESENPFLRTLFLSIAVAGDTDTIACMACSLAGAYYGASFIPEVLYHQCEAWEDIAKQADRLATLAGI